MYLKKVSGKKLKLNMMMKIEVMGEKDLLIEEILYYIY
jgi:hypothetical protein